MLKTKRYLHSTKKSLVSAKKQLDKVSQSRYVKDKRVWAGITVVAVVVIFGALPAYAADTPGQLGYGIKRFEESVTTTLAPTAALRDNLNLTFAERRINEAAHIASANVQDANTINQLLSQSTQTYQNYTTQLDTSLSQNKKSDSGNIESLQKHAVQAYAALALLRVQAPAEAQISVLTGIDATQKSIATINDALTSSPLSSSDVSQLTKLISVGILSKTDLDKLLSTQMDNRQFHSKLVELVDTKKLPSNLLYTLDEDLIKRLLPDKVASFEAVSDFEQMQRISATIQASRPSKDQQKAIQEYLSQYKIGDLIPDNDIRPFVAPIVYGMALAGELQTNLSSLSSIQLNSDDQAILDSWKGSLATNQQNLGQLYQQLMTGVANQPDLHERMLSRVQEEFVAAQKVGVDHLVLPPGWGEDQLADLARQMGIEVTANKFVAANPGTDQQLAVLANTQKQLQTSLDTVDQTHDTILKQLATQVNNFTGTPEQLTQLKTLLATLTSDQDKTFATLQTQLTGVNDLHTQLTSTVTTLHGQQLTSLTALELRAASNAHGLTAAAKAELTATLGDINLTTQNLIDGLQIRVSGMDTTQTALHERLDSSLENIRDTHAELVAYVGAQLAVGRETTAQLEHTLQSIETSLSSQAAQLTSLDTSTNALNHLIDQVQTTTNNQVTVIQGQIDGLTIDQQSVRDTIATLRTTQTTELNQLSNQLAHLSVLQTEAQVATTAIHQEQAVLQTSLGTITNNFAVLQTTLETVQNSQTTLNATLAGQQSQLDSLQTQSQSAIADLAQGQAQLAAQVASLSLTTTNLNQIVAAIQTTSTATSTQLDTLLANPPWSTIPAGTYATQADFTVLETSLNTQFAAKAAVLDAQFQTFQQQLNTELNQVNTAVTQLGQTTTTQNASQQQTIDTLNTQVQGLQAQIQALTPHTGL